MAKMDGSSIESRTVEAIETDRVGWQKKRDQLAADLTGATARQATATATLGALVTSQDTDERALKDSRAQRARLVAEIEELEAGLAAAEGRLLDLETEHREAEQRGREQTAERAIDASLAIAGDLDRAWKPVVALIQASLAAQRQAASALKALHPRGLYQVDPVVLGRILLHHVPALTPAARFASIQEQGSVKDWLDRHYGRASQKLVDGAGAKDERPQEAPGRGPKAVVSRVRAPMPADRDIELCVEECAEPRSCTSEACEVTRKRAATHVAIYHQRNTPTDARSA